MKKYTIYFQIGGHKLKKIVWANDENGAKDEVRRLIIFDEIKETKIPTSMNDILKDFGKIFNP